MKLPQLPTPARERLPKELVEKRHRDKSWYGFIHPRGWDDLIIELDEKLNEIFPNYEIYQSKEKFGGLRYYIGPYEELKDDQELSEKVRKVIGEYERRSTHTCQDCGAEAETRQTGGWFITLCDKCHKKDLERRQKEL